MPSRRARSGTTTGSNKPIAGTPRVESVAPEPMSSVDAAWWHMDRPHNPMVIVGVLRLRQAPTLKALRAVIGERLLAQPRFRQRPVHRDGADIWEVDARFRLDRHVVRRVLAAPADEAQLVALVEQGVSQTFTTAHPLWEIALVRMAGAAAAVLLRIHHCYADGLALIRLLTAITDGQALASPVAGSAPTPRTPSPPATEAAGGDGVLDRLMLLLNDAMNAVGAAEAHDDGTDADLAARAARYARVGVALGAEVIRFAEMPDESPTPFKGKPGPSKLVAWSDAVPVDQARLVARAFGCSIHAVLLSCLAAALGERLRAQGADPRHVEIRVLIPSPLRSARRASSRSGNHFGLVNLALPLGIGNPVARAWEVHRRIDALAATRQALVMHMMLGVVGLLPSELQHRALDVLSSKATAVITTVLGPPAQRYLAGAGIEDIMFWVPQAGDIGIGVSILSYDGRFRIGLMSDSVLLPQPRQVLDTAQAEFARLLPLAQVMAEQHAATSAVPAQD